MERSRRNDHRIDDLHDGRRRRPPFGHRWGLTQHLRDVSIAEMQELPTAAFSGEAGD
jgi:hypothetical protein